MKRTMMNIEWVAVECHICHSKKNPEPLKLHGSPLVDGQFGYAVHPVICECGLVYLNPRWSKDDYNVFYEKYYDDLYRLEIKPDYGVDGVIKNMVTILDRINIHIGKKVVNILDVGCGHGYGLKYLKEQIPDSTIYGIESSPECCKTLKIETIGATLITTDFDSNWTDKYKDKFDLIILRHVVEHMLEPIESMKKLKTVLGKKGFIYLSTPDMMHPRIELRDYDKWWEYWFRPVHPYYYCKETLMFTLRYAGLYPYIYGEEKEEIWCLVTSKESMEFEFKNVYEKQKTVLEKYLQLK